MRRIFESLMLRWDQDAWLVRNVKTEMRPIFELCSNPDPTAVSYFLFPEEFDFNFYNPFCQNLGGRVPMATSEENFHEVMDSLENIVKPDIHEKVIKSDFNRIESSFSQWSLVTAPTFRS